MLSSLLAAVVFGGFNGFGGLGQLLLAFVGLVLVLCIVFFIMKKLNAPDVLYTVLWVALAVIALIVVIGFFFGGHTGGGFGSASG